MKKNLQVIISLVIIMTAAMVAPVMAATTGTSVITGNPGALIDITVTGSISNWALAVGSNTNSTAVDLTVSSNKLWTVVVKDAMDGSKITGTEGKMANWTGSAYAASGNLATAMHVTGETVGGKTTGADVALSGGDQTIETGLDVVGAEPMDITIGQAVVYTDPTLPGTNVYRIIVTFTGSVT